MDKIIEVNGLKKAYGKIEAVRGIDFYVEKGKLFAFLGPNGAGKSTTIDIICTFLKPDAGTVTIDGEILGQDDTRIRNTVGAVFQDGLLDDLLTVRENMTARGGLYGLKGAALKTKVAAVAQLTGVTELLDRPYGKLSGGQRRRCDIARALINTPKILFLDEPTTGLDPQTRKNIWEIIRQIQRDNNMTVFLTTHYMEEAAAADYVIVIDHGLVVAKGTPIELKERYSTDRLIIDPQDLTYLAAKLTAANRLFTIENHQLEIPLADTMDALEVVEAYRQDINGFEVIRGTMDDAFIAITGKEIRE